MGAPRDAGSPPGFRERTDGVTKDDRDEPMFVPLSRRRTVALVAWAVAVLALYALARLHLLDAWWRSAP